MTNEECQKLDYINRVVGVQSGKSPEMISQTSEILQKHGLEMASNLIAGEQGYNRSFGVSLYVQWKLL